MKGLGLRASGLGCLLAIAAVQVSARADNITVGLFAPTAPFPTTAARVELASHLGDEVGKTLGVTATGKVFARASDFAAAVKKGEITVALVDSTYLAVAGGNYTVLASSVRASADAVSSAGSMPALDTASALAQLGLGKTDAVVVPAGVDLPAGTNVVLKLSSVTGPVLVAYGGLPAAQRTQLAAAAPGFHGDATLSGFRAPDADSVHSLAYRFAAPVKRGPLAVPAIRLLTGDLVEGRTFTIERAPLASFVAK